MGGIDTTFHISDLLVMAGALSTVIGFGARAITRAVKHKIAVIDRRLDDHGNTLQEHKRRIGDVETNVAHHADALRRLGFHRDEQGYKWRIDPEKDGV